MYNISEGQVTLKKKKIKPRVLKTEELDHAHMAHYNYNKIKTASRDNNHYDDDDLSTVACFYYCFWIM